MHRGNRKSRECRECRTYLQDYGLRGQLQEIPVFFSISYAIALTRLLYARLVLNRESYAGTRWASFASERSSPLLDWLESTIKSINFEGSKDQARVPEELATWPPVPSEKQFVFNWQLDSHCHPSRARFLFLIQRSPNPPKNARWLSRVSHFADRFRKIASIWPSGAEFI